MTFCYISKKNFNSLSFYWKYNHKSQLKEREKSYHLLLYKMSFKKLDIIKFYFHLYLVQDFISVSLIFYSSLVLFIKKPGREIWFCINYEKFNAIIKKDYYSILFIEETLA